MDASNKPQLPSFHLVPITENDEMAVLNFLKEYFLPEIPLKLNLQDIDENTERQFEKSCAPCLRNGISMMAISETGDIMGVRLNRLIHRDDEDCSSHDQNCDDNPFSILIDKIWQEMDVFGRYPNVDTLLELKCVAVKPAYRRLGICKAFYNRTIEIASKLKCQMMYVVCVSNYTANAVEKLGFQCLYSLFHSDVVNKQGQAMFKMEPPHEYIKGYLLAV